MNLRTGVFLVLLTGLFLVIGSLFGLVGAACALALSTVVSFWSYWSAGPEIIAHLGAQDVTDPSLLALLDGLSKRAGLPAPRLFVVDDAQPNALAVGSDPSTTAIIVTSALVDELPRDELAAVLAHELAHIRNKDIFAATLAVTFLSAVLMLAITLGLIGAVLGRRSGAGMVILAALAPLIGLVIGCAMSRASEYRADSEAAQLCGSVAAVVAALRRTARLSKRTCHAARRDACLAPMFFVQPLPGDWLGRMLSAHPPIERRIARLLAQP